DEGARGSDAAANARLALERDRAHLHLRLHRRPRTDAADDQPPYGEAERCGACGISQERHLDLLHAPRQIADRDERVAKQAAGLGFGRYCYRVRAAGVALLLTLALAACGGSPAPSAHTTPSTSPTEGATAAASTSPSAGATPTTMASAVHCAAAVPAGDNLVIGTVVGDPTVVVRDIQDPAHARTVCTFDTTALSPQFVSAATVAYETSANQIVKADLSGGAAT